MTGPAKYLDPLDGTLFDEAGQVTQADRAAHTHALIVANIHKLAGGDPGAMTRKNYLRQGPSFMALCAPLWPVPRIRR